MLKTQQWLILILLYILVFGTLTAVAHAVFQNNTPGIDYYVYWQAGRTFFNGQDPYSAENQQQIQQGIYGHPAGPNDNKMVFANPPYAFFVMLPLLWLNFDWSFAAWMVSNILILLALSIILFPKSPRWIRISFPFFFPFVFGYVMGNFAVMISAFLLIFFRYFTETDDPPWFMQVLTGILMAWCTVKPQFVWAFLILFFLYGLKQRLWKMLGSFIVSLTGMVLITMLFRADWLLKWVGELISYKTTNTGSPVITLYLAQFLPTPAMSIALFMIGTVCVGLSFYLGCRWWRRQLDPLVLLAWAGFITYLVHPSGGGGVSYEHAAFVLPFFLWALRQKNSRLSLPIWLTAWVSSYLFDATSLIKTSIWSGQYFFLMYALWLTGIMAKPALHALSNNILVRSS